MTEQIDLDALIAEARRFALIDRISHEPVVAMLARVTAALESTLAEQAHREAAPKVIERHDFVMPDPDAPTDDERELLAEADALVASWDLKGSWVPESPVGLVMRLATALRRTVQGAPTERPSFDAFGEPRNRAAQELQAQGEPSQHIVSCAKCGQHPVVAADTINSDIVVCDRCAFEEGRESVQADPIEGGCRAEGHGGPR